MTFLLYIRIYDCQSHLGRRTTKPTKWASPPSLIRDYHCPHQETLGPELPTEPTAKIRTGYTGYFVGFVTVTTSIQF